MKISTRIQHLFREPLIHFVLAGGLLFLITAQFGSSDENDQQTIIVSAEQIDQLRTQMQGLLKRELTPDEMQKAIAHYITEEVLVREGLKLGVVEEDPAMRRSVAEKVTFLLSDTTLVSEPTEGMLQDFMQKNIALFTQLPRRSFMHIYVDPAKHINTLDADVKKIQATLSTQPQIDPLTLSDTFAHGNEYQRMDQTALNGVFGDAFTTALFAAPLTTWQGPINSKLGVHFIFVSEALPATQPTFAEVREQVRKVYLDAQHRLQNEAAVNQLKQQYQITIEQPNTK